MRVGIIGAGAAGLAAAYDFVGAGHDVTVYESAPFVGGQASTIEVGGGRLERGYHHLFTNDTAIVDLMGELGIGDSLKWFPSTVGTYANGKLYPFVTATDLLRFSPLSMRDRIRLGLLTMRLRYRKNWRALEGLTATEWVKKYGSDGIYDTIWGPLLRGKFGKYHDRVGMAWLWSKFQTRVASRKGLLGREMLGYPVNSFDEIFETLVTRIEAGGGRVLLETPVERVVVQGDTATGLVARDRADDAIEEGFDVILATAPSFIFKKLVDLPDHYRQRLENVHYLAAVIVILELAHPLTSTYWINITDRSIPFLGVIEQTNLMPRERYGGSYVVYLTNYLDREDELYGLSKDELVERYMPHLRKFNSEFDPSWVTRVHYNKVSAAQPIIEPNYSQRIPSHRTPVERLYLANTTQIYPEDRGTNYSVRMGRQVARMMMEAHG